MQVELSLRLELAKLSEYFSDSEFHTVGAAMAKARDRSEKKIWVVETPAAKELVSCVNLTVAPSQRPML